MAAVAESAGGRADIAAVYLYGSTARGDATTLSDVDVAVLFARGHASPAERRMAMSEVAASVSERLHPRHTRVDVRDVETLPLVIQGEVVTEGRLAVGNDEPARVRFETGVRQRYFDFLPFREASVRPALRAMRERHSNG